MRHHNWRHPIRSKKLFVVALAGLLVLAGCGSSDPVDSATVKDVKPFTEMGKLEKPVTLRLGLIKTSSTQFAQAAGEILGTWKKIDPNLNVELKSFSSAKPIVEAIAAGDLDAGQGSSVAFLSAASQGIDTVAVGTVGLSTAWTEGPGHGKDAFVVPVKSPIKDLKGLRGKKIGLTLNSGSELSMQEVLDKAGLPIGSYKPVNVDPGSASAVLTSGGVDAVYLFEPTPTLLVRSQKIGRILFRDDIYGGSTNVFMTRKFLNNQPEAARKFMLGFAVNSWWVTSHPVEASLLAVNELKIQMDPVDFLYSWYGNLAYDTRLDKKMVDELYRPFSLKSIQYTQKIKNFPDMPEKEIVALIDKHTTTELSDWVTDTPWFKANDGWWEKYSTKVPIETVEKDLTDATWPMTLSLDLVGM